MGDSTAKVGIEGDNSQMIREIQELRKAFGDLGKVIIDMGEKSKKSQQDFFDVAGKGLKGMVRDVMAVGTAWLSVQGLTQAAAREYEKFKNQLNTSASVGEQFNSAISAAYRNAPQGVTKEQLTQVAFNVRSKAGIPAVDVANAMPAVLAAGGSSLTLSSLEDVLSAAVPLAAENKEEFSGVAASTAAFLSKMPGQNLSAAQVAGFLQKASGGSSVDKYSLYGPEASKVASAALAQGLQPEQMIAIFNATTRGISDETGEVSRTAAISLGGLLSEQRTALKVSSNKPSDVIDAIMRQSPAYINKFVGSLGGKEQTKDFIKSMFQTGGVGNRFLGAAIAETPSFATGLQTYNEMVAGQMASPYTKAVRAEQIINAGAEGFDLRPDRVEAGTYSRAMERYRKSAGGFAFGDWLDEKSLDFAIANGGNARDSVISSLEFEATRLRRGKTLSHQFRGGGTPTTVPPSSDAILASDAMLQMVALLRQLNGNFSAQQIEPNGDRPKVREWFGSWKYGPKSWDYGLGGRGSH